MIMSRATQESVIIVSGLPRSGTSLMMQMLEAGGLVPLTDLIRQPDEDNPRGYYEFEPVKQVADDSSWVPEARGKVVKMVYRLLSDLPAGYSYRVVFMRRNLEEVIASQDKMLSRQGKTDGGLTREQLLQAYRRELQRMDDWLQGRPNFSVLYVDHADVLNEPDRIARELNEFLGGNLNVEGMRAVPDPSLHRQKR
jgi:hypothetical protein